MPPGKLDGKTLEGWLWDAACKNKGINKPYFFAWERERIGDDEWKRGFDIPQVVI
jgi:hypothetical protein